MTELKRPTDAEKIAETFGIVLGAASQSRTADDERLSSLADKMTQVVSTIAADEGDAEAAQKRFFAAVEVGRTAAEDGRIDPRMTETALNQIEQEILV
jgi:hypothetical protein